MKKYFLIIAGTGILLTAGFLAGIYAQKRLPAGGFLQSTAAVIRLGVWDKQGTAKSNKTIFTVIAPDGKQAKAEKNEPLDDWVYADFPDNFSPYNEADGLATYKWTATVDGKIVAGGSFKYGNGRADGN